jgi:hypothetical protein
MADDEAPHETVLPSAAHADPEKLSTIVRSDRPFALRVHTAALGLDTNSEPPVQLTPSSSGVGFPAAAVTANKGPTILGQPSPGGGFDTGAFNRDAFYGLVSAQTSEAGPAPDWVQAISNPDPAVEREIAESAFQEETSEGRRTVTSVNDNAPLTPPQSRKRTRKTSGINIKIKSRSQVIQYSRILIAALEEVVDYDPTRHHNRPPPELRINDEDYLTEIRNLIAELRTLNSLLETTRRQPKKSAEAVVKLTRHFDTFLNSYAKSLAKGAGWLTIGVIASLLYQAGIGQAVIANILSHAKLPH